MGKKKTSKNSSTPPSRDQKGNIPDKKKARREGSVGRKGNARDLHADPDEMLESTLKNCPQCGGTFTEADQKLSAEYDTIEIPPIHPKVTRVHLYSCTCKSCGVTYKAPAPQGFEEGSPFGRSIEGLMTYLRYNHYISYKRLSDIFTHLFDLSVSQGGHCEYFQAFEHAI